MVKYTEQEIENRARSARVICEASDGKVSEFAFNLSKDIIRGNITADEYAGKILEHYKELGYLNNA